MIAGMFTPGSFALALTLFASTPPYPEDPFADEYRVPASSEVGVGEGQLRPMLLGGYLANGGGLVVRGTTEYTASTFFALRASMEVQRSAGTALQAQSARAGAAMHLLPYRRVDVGVWFEAGPSWVQQPTGASRWAPLLVGGVSLDIGITTLLFARVEAQLGWATVAPSTYLRPAVLAGFGVAL